jgi:hypothetical protein
LYESVILSLGIIVILFYAKACSVYWWNDASYQEMYGPDFVNAKLDRMSLFSADLLRSGFFYRSDGIRIMVVNKRKICSKHTIQLWDF